jgi:hypothetical protein
LGRIKDVIIISVDRESIKNVLNVPDLCCSASASRYSVKNLYVFPESPMRVTCPANVILFYFIYLSIHGE